MRKRATALLMAALMLMGLWPGLRPARAEGASLTLMVYMCGSNLESRFSAATADLLEMANAGYDLRKVNVLVMTGGTERWAMDLPTDALCVYMPGRGSLRMMYAFESMSMGAPGALTALLDYGYERYPADRYALILWDHGGGPMNGVCWDELYDSDRLTMEELCQALAASPAANEPLEWIGFDACLMASAEVASLMAPYARYMVASEETEPGTGWNYAFLKGIEADADGAATGKRIIDDYFAAAPDDGQLTLSCVDLHQVDALRERMDGFFPSLEISGGNYALFSYAARNTRAFGKGAAGSDSYDLIDLAALVEHLSGRPGADPEPLREALERAVVYSRSGDGAGGGLSVYHPYENRQEYADAWSTLYPALGFSEGYADYIARFAGYLFGSVALAWDQLGVAPTDRPDVYALPLTPRQQEMLSGAVMNVLRWDEAGGAYASVCAVNRLELKDGVLYGALPGQYLSAVSPEGEVLCEAVPYELLSDGGVGVYVNYCMAGASGSEAAAAQVAVDTRGARKSLGGYSFEEDESGSDGLSGQTADVDVGAAGSGVSQDTAETGSASLREVLAQSSVQVAQVSPLRPEELIEAVTVPQAVSLFSGASPVAVGSAGAPLSFAPAGETTAQIVPVEGFTEAMAGQTPSIIGSATPQIPLDAFASVELERFVPEQVEIDLSGFAPGEPEAQARPEVLHAYLRCESDESGRLRVMETWLYDEATGIWSTRGALDGSLYPEAAFPRSWRKPTGADGALAGFERWSEVYTSSQVVTGANWQLRFTPGDGGEALCLSFQLTDAQNQTHSSVPLLLSGAEE